MRARGLFVLVLGCMQFIVTGCSVSIRLGGGLPGLAGAAAGLPPPVAEDANPDDADDAAGGNEWVDVVNPGDDSPPVVPISGEARATGGGNGTAPLNQDVVRGRPATPARTEPTARAAERSATQIALDRAASASTKTARAAAEAGVRLR